MYSRKLSKSVRALFPRTVFEVYSGLSPENYSVLLAPVPSFLRKRTPSLAAFPKLVKGFQSASFKKTGSLVFPGSCGLSVANLILPASSTQVGLPLFGAKP